MRINPIQFNFIQRKPQSTVNRSLYMNKELQSDTVCFTGLFSKRKKEKDLENLVPKNKGIIYKKVKDEETNVINKVPIEVDIVRSSVERGVFGFEHNGEKVGYVKLTYFPKGCVDKNDCFGIWKNYRKEGIKGDRIIVDMLKNYKEEEYGGIGHLADLIEVACCQELGIKPNVVSNSLRDAAPIHYLRGKRFVPYEQYHTRKEMRRDDLKGKNPNDEVRKVIENTKKGEKFNTKELEYGMIMYMPKEMIKELEEELKEHPIF